MSAPEAKNRKLEIAAARPVPTASSSCATTASASVGAGAWPGGLHPRHDERGVLARLLPRPCRGRGRRARARWRRCRGRRAPRGSVGSGADASSSSRCDRTDTYSPAPIESAPASRPAMPVKSTTEARDAGRADAEHEREVRDEAVVRAEHRRAERAGEAPPAAGREPAHDLAVDALVGGHRRGRVGVGRVRRSGLGALCEREHEDRAEPAGEGAEQARAHVGAGGPGVVAAEQGEPVRLVASLGGGEREQDLALLAVAARGELAVDRGLGALVGEVPAPPRPVGRGRRRAARRSSAPHPDPGAAGGAPGASRSVTSLPPSRPQPRYRRGAAASARFAGIGSISERRTGRPRIRRSLLRPPARDEVDELLDAAEQRGLEVAVAAHAAEDVLPGARDVGLVGVRPSERLADAVLPLGAARDHRPGRRGRGGPASPPARRR